MSSNASTRLTGEKEAVAAWLWLDGWEGVTRTPVLVVGETPRRYRIRPAGTRAVKLAGRQRWLVPDSTTLVPKHAISFATEAGND